MQLSPSIQKKNFTIDHVLAEVSAYRLWTVRDVSHYLSLNPETVRLMIRRGEIPAQKVGRVWRFDPETIIGKYSNNTQEIVEEQIQGEGDVVKG